MTNLDAHTPLSINFVSHYTHKFPAYPAHVRNEVQSISPYFLKSLAHTLCAFTQEFEHGLYNLE